MSSTLTNTGRLLGAVGVVLLISSPLTWLLTAEFGPWFWGKFTMGGVLIAVYLLTNADFFGRVAGARSSGLVTMSAFTVALVLGVVGAANYAVYKHPKDFDFTKEGIYTLSPQTTDLLGRLDTDVHVAAFFASFEPQYAQIQEFLERYKNQGKHFSYEMVDPQTRPDLVEKYQLTEQGPRIVVEAKEHEARVKEIDEQEFTNAIMKVTEQSTKTVYFMTGHGEGDIGSADAAEGYKQLADAVRSEGYKAEPLSLQASQSSPVGTKVDLKAGGSGKLEVPIDAQVKQSRFAGSIYSNRFCKPFLQHHRLG